MVQQVFRILHSDANHRLIAECETFNFPLIIHDLFGTMNVAIRLRVEGLFLHYIDCGVAVRWRRPDLSLATSEIFIGYFI